MTKKKVTRGYPSTFPSKRVFQRKKRRDLLVLKRAIDEARLGCAYLPGYPDTWRKLESSFYAIFEATRPGVWK
jgi:hypothetical protein